VAQIKNTNVGGEASWKVVKW